MTKHIAAALATLVFALAGCEKTDAPGGGAAASRAAPAGPGTGGPPVSVGTVRAEQRDYPVTLEATGTVVALNTVEVKPQLSSTVSKVHFREGQFVKAGQLLFTLDARQDETNVAKAQAQLQKDLAALADAQRQLARSRELLQQNFVSQGAVDQNQAQVDAQRAVVEADRAALRAAQVGLSYTRITAPMSGRAGLIAIHPGALVSPSSPALVTIAQLDPIAVTFSLPQRHLQPVLQSLRAGGGTVVAELPDAGGRLTGKLAFVDNTVDAATGTVKVKAQFDNRGEKLWPGAFVNVSLAVQTLAGAIVVPQASIVQGARGKQVYVVEDGKAAARAVEVLHAAGQDAVVTGLKAGDRVVLEGRANLRPGSPVAERAADSASAPAAAASAKG